MRKGRMPESIFVAPTATKEKEEHKYTLLAIEEWDELGIPLRVRLIRDDEIIDVRVAVNGGVRFMTAYLPAAALVENPENANLKAKPLQRATRNDGK